MVRYCDWLNLNVTLKNHLHFRLVARTERRQHRLVSQQLHDRRKRQRRLAHLCDGRECARHRRRPLLIHIQQRQRVDIRQRRSSWDHRSTANRSRMVQGAQSEGSSWSRATKLSPRTARISLKYAISRCGLIAASRHQQFRHVDDAERCVACGKRKWKREDRREAGVEWQELVLWRYHARSMWYGAEYAWTWWWLFDTRLGDECEFLLSVQIFLNFSINYLSNIPQGGDFSVSLKAPGRNKHFRVNVDNGMYCIGQRKFQTLDQLVDHYQRAPIYTNKQGEKLYLVRSLPKASNNGA